MREDEHPDEQILTGLRHDHSSTELERIPALWWQKFVVVGATGATVVSRDVLVPSDAMALSAAVCLPLIAALIDVKAAEYAINMRAIAEHITANGDRWPLHAAWYRRHWNGPEANLRSLLSLASAAGPTVAIAGAAGWLCWVAAAPSPARTAVLAFDATLAGATLLGGFIAALRFFRRLP